MRCLARTSLGMLGLTLIAPMGVNAQDVSTTAPSGYQAAAPASAVPDGYPMPAPSMPSTPRPAPAKPVVRKHSAFHIHCAQCAADQAAAKKVAQANPPGKIVGCAHSRNGVCTACQAALRMPGQFVEVGATTPEVSGRAVVSSDPHPTGTAAQMASHPGQGMASAPYDGLSGEPAPVGVIQANFNVANPSGMPVASANPASQPGRAVAESPAGHDPYQEKSGGFPHPHIIGHIFGWSGLGGERADEKARRKAEAHAMIRYDDTGTADVNDLPASMVFGKKGR